jgi:hypothetical protein
MKTNCKPVIYCLQTDCKHFANTVQTGHIRYSFLARCGRSSASEFESSNSPASEADEETPDARISIFSARKIDQRRQSYFQWHHVQDLRIIIYSCRVFIKHAMECKYASFWRYWLRGSCGFAAVRHCNRIGLLSKSKWQLEFFLPDTSWAEAGTQWRDATFDGGEEMMACMYSALS